MTSIASLATHYDMEPYAVADALNLGAEWDATAELADATAGEYIEVLDIMAQQTADLT